MRVFLTGATGFVGSRVLIKLLEHGHAVTALVRKEKDAETMRARGAKTVTGDLSSLTVISKAAKNADVVVHLAFIHDFSLYVESLRIESRVVECVNAALAGSGKKFICASATSVAGDTGAKPSAEAKLSEQGRGACETDALKGISRGVEVFILRLPPYVHEKSDFVSFMANVHVQAAKKEGKVPYVGSGSQTFSAIHVEDAATAFVAAAETGTKAGVYNIAGQQSMTALQLAEAVSKKLSRPGNELSLWSLNETEGKQIYGALASRFGMNNNVDSAKARLEFRWEPQFTSGFLEAVAKS